MVVDERRCLESSPRIEATRAINLRSLPTLSVQRHVTDGVKMHNSLENEDVSTETGFFLTFFEYICDLEFFVPFYSV